VFDAGANGRPRKRPVDGECGLSALESPEADRLGDGLLPGEGPAGRALGRLAREIAGLRVGLALGAGAIKGYAHAGVLQALATLGVPVDYIAGTSIGSAVAALYASGVGPDRIAGHLDEVGGAAFRPRLPRSSLLSSDGVREGLRRIAGDARIEDMAVPLAVVTADLLTHREVIFRRGRVWPAVLASMSIPGIYPPVRVGGALLVDGGILNPVPTDVVAAMGADVVIAVKLASRPEPPDAEARVAVPTVIQAIARSVEVMQTRITSYTAATATVLLEPEFESGEGWGLRHFSAGRRFISLGGETVHAALPRLAEALPWLREGAGQGDVAASGASDAAASSIA